MKTPQALVNLLKPETFLPPPAGPYEVGYLDIMTDGKPKDSSFIRLYYPTQQQHRFLPERCPIWTEHDTKHGFINFLQAMIKRWPSWVNDSEFTMLGVVRSLESIISWAFTPVFSMGWGILAKNPRIPVIHQAQPSSSTAGEKWPVVVFSHGMGCNRYAYSKVCYDLCSEGVVVASVEHRDGSACHSIYVSGGENVPIPHLNLAPGEDEYTVRNLQVQQRAGEVSRALDILVKLNEGLSPDNILQQGAGYSFDHFKGQLEIDEPYVIGHSFGGSTTLLAAAQDPRFQGAVAIDPWMFPVSEQRFAVTKPVLMLNTELFLHKNNVDKVREVCGDLNARVLDGAVHMVHTDAPLLFENDLLKSGLGMACSRGTEEVLAENHSILWDWISRSLQGFKIEKRADWGLL
jgi:platelet-activating factor acetylhydrolase